MELAKSLSQTANLYIGDEPLNYLIVLTQKSMPVEGRLQLACLRIYKVLLKRL